MMILMVRRVGREEDLIDNIIHESVCKLIFN